MEPLHEIREETDEQDEQNGEEHSTQYTSYPVAESTIGDDDDAYSTITNYPAGPGSSGTSRIISPRQRLRDYCLYKDLPRPVYLLVNVTRNATHQKWYTMELTIDGLLTVNESAVSKRFAEFRSATAAIHLIGTRDPSIFQPIPRRQNFSLSRSLSMDYLTRRRRRRVGSNGSINTMMTFNNLSSVAPSIEGIDADSLYGSEHGHTMSAQTQKKLNEIILSAKAPTSPEEESPTAESNEIINPDSSNESQASSQNSQNGEQASASVSIDEGVFCGAGEGSSELSQSLATSARSSALTTPSVSPSKTPLENGQIEREEQRSRNSGRSKLERKKSRSSSSILASIFSLGIWRPKANRVANSTSPSKEPHYEVLDQPDNRTNGQAEHAVDTIECEIANLQTSSPSDHSQTANDDIDSPNSNVATNGTVSQCQCRHFSLYGSLLCCGHNGAASSLLSAPIDRTPSAMLLKYCVLMYMPIPYYDIHFDENSRFNVICRILITCNNEAQINKKPNLRQLFDKLRDVREMSGRGQGETLRAARNAAGEKVIAKLRQIGAYLET